MGLPAGWPAPGEAEPDPGVCRTAAVSLESIQSRICIRWAQWSLLR